MKFIKLSLVWPITAGLLACAPMGSDPNLARRVDEQDIQLRQMQPQQADTWNEVQAMREEINQLKGQIAQMRQQGGMPAPDAATMPSAAAGTNAALPVAAAGTAMPISQGVTEPVTGIIPQPGNAPESSAYRAAPGALPSTATALPQPTSVAPAQADGNYGLPADQTPVAATAPSGATWGMADPQPAAPAAAAPAPQKDLATALFESGQNSYKARKYKAAENSFNDFIKNYPKNAKVPDAQYYLAECYFAANNYTQAALAFDDIVRKYPKSGFIREAYLKEGIAFSKMGRPDAARLRLNELIKKFPNSAEAKRAQAFLKTNK